MMDEFEGTAVERVGEQLRAAREAKKMSVEEIAAATRIPTRHLESLETSEWDKLPAPTYSIGFAKAYAGAVGLDRDAIGDQLRTEMGGIRRPTVAPDLFEPTDPKRTMPKGLVFGALAGILLVALLLTWLNGRALDGGDEPAAAPTENIATAAAPTPAPATAGPVVVTANTAVWVDIRDGQAILKQGELAAGQSFEVPANAVAPTLTTGKPEGLRISVGTADAPAIGPAGQTVRNVSLKAADLLKGPAASATATSAPPPAAATPAAPRPTARPRPARTTAQPAAPTTTPPAPSTEPSPVTNSN